ncbi:hypothetical protein HTS61_09340 [Escherichia coli]|nr:hypothetical protein [Escherichia coli]
MKKKASATTADNQSTQAEEHPRSEDTPETSLSDAGRDTALHHNAV